MKGTTFMDSTFFTAQSLGFAINLMGLRVNRVVENIPFSD
ncbi:hypothetical protein HP2RS_01420 [Helicobacter pylori]|nr:hypothetical protein C695_07500 [Helicobacter pylori Rif1]EIE28922.1 hypothetical protein HP2RS_01420 [Helicobacter pylori]